MNAKHLHTTSLNRSNFGGINLAVTYLNPDTLTPPTRQVRRRTKAHIGRIARSISDFGMLNPIIVDGQLNVVAGVSRWEAAKLLGQTSVPVIRVEHLTEAQLRLFAIADNKLPEGVEWLGDQLLIEFQEIELLEPQIDLTTSGYAIAEIDQLYGQARAAELSEYDDPPKPQIIPINRIGDIWKLGRHILGCGDARDRELLRSLLGERRARIMLTDPPWNLKIEGVVSGQGKVKHQDFVMGAGEMSKSTFVAFLTHFIQAGQHHLLDGALLFIFMDWRNLHALDAAAESSGLQQKNLLVWCKDNAGLGSLYRSRHELVGLYKHGKAPHTNNILMGRHGRNRSNVIFAPGANTFTKDRQKALESHPTSKPPGLLADFILDTTAPEDLVLDQFGGSGSTLIAAEKTDRDACLVELDPIYADVIIRRFEQVTGQQAIHVETGKTFADIALERAPDPEPQDGETGND